MPLAPANPAVDEEDDSPPPPKPLIGTTGGVIPEQQSEIDARKPIQWQADPMARKAQVQGEIDRRRQATFQQEHPFTPSGWQQNVNTPETRRQDREFESDAESQFNYQEQSARQAEIEKRRQGIAARNASNNQLEAQYRGSGQQFYTDANGAIQPVIDSESGRPLFHATGWEVGTHPKTGKPALTMRDKYGQRQFKEPPVVQSLDPMDDQMHYKLPDGSTVPAGSIDDFAKSPNYAVAKAALAAKTRQVKAVHQEALQPIRLMADQAVAQLEDAKGEIQGLDADIEKLSTQVANSTGPDGSPTPLSEGLGASLAQMQARREQLGSMIKPRGELAQKAARAKAGFAIASATAMREAFIAQQAEIAARVKSTGGNLEADPTYQANLRGLRSAEQILGAGQQEIGGAKAAPAAAPVGQPVASAAMSNGESPATSPLEQSEPYIASQNGITHVGSVKMDEFARRYGDGRGPVRPDQLIKLQKRSKEIDQVLANDDTSINQTMRDQFTKEKDYVDSLAKQRFARLPDAEQKRVAEATRDPTWWDALKGAGKSLAEEAAVGGASALKGAELASFNMVNSDEFGNINPDAAAELERRRNLSPSAKMEEVKKGPAYQLGNLIQEAAHEAYAKGAHENETAVAKALSAATGAAGGFAPLVASGPMAPVTMGLQTAGEEMQRIYDDFIKKGVDPERAADAAQKRALASGAVTGLLFELLPKQLQKAGNKYVVDKIAGGMLKKFFVNRGVQAGEGAILGGASTAAGNVAAGRDVGEGVAESAGGLALMQAAMPRAGRPGEKPKGGEPIPASESRGPLTPEQQAAEAEFQKQLSSDAAPANEADTAIDRINKGILDQGGKSAADSAQVFEPALKEKDNAPPPAKSAEESAAVMQDSATTEEAGNKVASQQEAKAQQLVDQIQEATGKPREEILATRNGRDASEWNKELETEAKYHANPLIVDPERRATELKGEISKLDEEWAKHLDKTAAEAEAHAQIQGDKDKAAAQFQATKARHDSLMERRGAIEQQLSEAERVRQSNKGGADLRKDLAAKEGREPPEGPAGAPAEKPTPPPAGSPKSDFARYKEIEAEWKALPAEERGIDNPKVKKLFAENEEIKNRHGGMPPTEAKADLLKGDNFDKEWRDQGGRGGSENQVVFRDGKVYKRNYSAKTGQAVPNYGSIEKFNEHVALHNELFPSAKITVEGMSQTSDGPAPVVSQPEIKGTPASAKEIDAYMRERGFKPTDNGRTRYLNDKTGVEVSDLRDGNVLKDDKGELHVIDPVVKQIKKTNQKSKPEVKSDATSEGQQPKNDQLQHSRAAQGPAVRENVGEVRGEKGAEAGRGDRPISSEKNRGEPSAAKEVVHEIVPPKDAAPISADIEKHTAETVEGEKINKNWTAFGPESGTLGVPRAEMPQIKSEHRGALVNFLQARGVKAKRVMVRPGDLKPTQAEFSPGKVDTAREFRGSERPILISGDGHLVDGHHQWMAGLQDDPKTPMPAIKLEAPIDKVLAEMKEFPSTENAQGVAAKAATKEPSVSAPPATKRLSDRAIEALQKAKIDTKGKLFDVTQGAYVAAHNAAIDLAILGVRAGRLAVDVTKLAVARFKAKFPDHTPEQLQKLESEIKTAIANERPPSPEMRAAESKTEAVIDSKPAKEGRSKIAKAWEKARGESDLKKTLASTRDAADNIAASVADETHTSISAELNRSVSEKDRQVAADALAFHVESGGGGVAKLKEMRAKVEGSEKADPKWKKRALDAIDYAIANYSSLKSSADLYRSFTDKQAGDEQAAGMPTLKRENYVMHAQDVDEGGWLDSRGSMSPTGASSRKNRTFETFADSIAAGIDPKTLNALDLLKSRVKAGQTGINLRQWQASLKDYIDPTTKEPIATKPERVERADGTFYFQAPKGYENEMLGGTPVAVKKEYAGIIGALTDPSWWSKTQGRRLTQKLNGGAKSINLLIDTFHLGRLALRQSILKSASLSDPRVPLPSYKEGKTILEHSPEEMAKMAKSGEISPEALPDLLDKKAKLNRLVSAGLNTGHVADALHQEMVRSLPFLGDINKFIFEKFQRGAMAESAIMELERQTKSYPDLEPAEVARRVATDINTRFGNLGRQGLFKSKTAQDIARLIWLAPQWNEGLIRSELGGAGQVAKSAFDAVTGRRLAMGTLGRDMIAGTLGIFIANQLINQATRNKFTWENPEEGWGAKLSAWIPDSVGGKSSGFFLNPLGVTAEISHMLLNSYERKDSAWEAMKDFAKSRSSAAARPVMTWLTGKDALGGNIRTGDMTKEVLKSAAPVPIGGSAAVSALRGMANGGNTETYPGQFQKQVMQTFGLKTDTAPSPEQRIQALAKDFKAKKGIEASAEFYAGDYSDLTNALRRNNPKDIDTEIKALLPKKSADEIRKHYQSWGKTPFTGQRDREAEFLKTLNPEQRSIYVRAQQERLKIGQRALSKVSALPRPLIGAGAPGRN